MQGDGNLVLLDGDGNAVWTSNTWGHEGAYLQFENNCNLVVYDADESVL